MPGILRSSPADTVYGFLNHFLQRDFTVFTSHIGLQLLKSRMEQFRGNRLDSLLDCQKRHNHSPLDRYSYDKLVYDEAGEPDVERVNALYYIPPEGQGYRMVDDDDMPF